MVPRCQFIPCPWQDQHALVVRNAAPLYGLEYVIDHTLIAIHHRSDIDLSDCPVDLVEMRAGLEMILKRLTQSGPVRN